MQKIIRTSDKGFQFAAILMVVFSILQFISVGADPFNVLALPDNSEKSDPSGLMIMAVLAVTNLVIAYTRNALRFYVGYRFTERIYILFLLGWCTYLLYYLFNLLISRFLIQ